ncbi:S8 family serine peptidase [bacterium]|nr:S8 family serine peptidase [bacterium]
MVRISRRFMGDSAKDGLFFRPKLLCLFLLSWFASNALAQTPNPNEGWNLTNTNDTQNVLKDCKGAQTNIAESLPCQSYNADLFESLDSSGKGTCDSDIFAYRVGADSSFFYFEFELAGSWNQCEYPDQSGESHQYVLEIDVDRSSETPNRYDYVFIYTPQKKHQGGKWVPVDNFNSGDDKLKAFQDSDNDLGGPYPYSPDHSFLGDNCPGSACDGYEKDFFGRSNSSNEWYARILDRGGKNIPQIAVRRSAFISAPARIRSRAWSSGSSSFDKNHFSYHDQFSSKDLMGDNIDNVCGTNDDTCPESGDNPVQDDPHSALEILARLKPEVSVGTIIYRYNLNWLGEISLDQNSHTFEVGSAADLDVTLGAMQQDPQIIWATPNFFSQSPEGERGKLAVTDTDSRDSKYQDQQALQRIKSAEALQYSNGNGVTVAVLDTGVDYKHPALGYSISPAGWDFIDNDDNPQEELDGLDEDYDGLIDEGAGHGTHVSGIIHAVAPEAWILPIRVLNSDGVGTADVIARGIYYAVDAGAQIINLSLGMKKPSAAIEDAIKVAVLNNISVIASAGNDGRSTPRRYPAASAEVIAVGATDPEDKKSSFSNYGDWIDVSAPGTGIYSTFPGGQFAWWEGTSMSAAFVSGEIALLRSLSQNWNKTAQEIRQMMLDGADNIDALNPPYQQLLGAGRINLLRAIDPF